MEPLMFVHASNLEQKEQSKPREKYGDPTSKRYLSEIRARYNEWKAANTALVGPKSAPASSDKETVAKRVQLLEDYKNFIDQQKYAEHFDSRSDLHSTVMEEFLYYLFRDLVADFGNRALIGKIRAFKDIFFVPPNYKGMTERAWSNIERKDHDFVIGVTIEVMLRTTAQNGDSGDFRQATINNTPQSTASGVEKQMLDVPAVVIECKTYLDKAMLEGCSRAAEELKARNPNSIYIVVMEWLKLAEAVNLRKYKLDQIYVLRTDINVDREFRFAPDYVKHPIEIDAVWNLYEVVRKHLTTDWQISIKNGLKRGWLI
jgi:hypothetical protein